MTSDKLVVFNDYKQNIGDGVTLSRAVYARIANDALGEPKNNLRAECTYSGRFDNMRRENQNYSIGDHIE